MSLKDYTIKYEYRSSIDNVVQDFYLPLLQEAQEYRRSVGYFSSSSLVEISKGIAAIAKKGGSIKIVSSPNLTAEDWDAIKEGYERREEVIEEALLRELKEGPFDYFTEQRLNLLANLIADGILDFKIAFTDSQKEPGIYHEKLGLITDIEGNTVAFGGSLNETKNAFESNYETIDVFCDWKNEAERERVENKQAAFDRIWNDKEKSLKVLEFPKVKEQFIQNYKKGKPDYDIDLKQYPLIDNLPDVISDKPSEFEVRNEQRPSIPDNVHLFDYQEQAIISWVGENYRGIFDMATGTGKTFTALGAMVRFAESFNYKVNIVIVCPYQHLVNQWLEDLEKFHFEPIVGFSSSPQKDWETRLKREVRNQRLHIATKPLCFICTNSTFKSKKVQDEIEKFKWPTLLVVDEAHNIGAASYRPLLDDRFQYRLALSATLERFRDKEGSQALLDYFGKKCIEYDLEQAIQEAKLTPYLYYPVFVYLTDDELRKYNDLTKEIGKCLIKGKNGAKQLTSRGELLLLQRARLVAGAINKITKLKEVIEPYRESYNLLIYCGSTTVKDDPYDDEKEEIRQVEAVTRLLGKELGMRVSRFTSQENASERESLKERFASGDDLQALVAIRCLDEGVNIPGIDTAFILASSTNPKEFIQRRGRVLRKAPGKKIARIFDFITLPRPLELNREIDPQKLQSEKRLAINEYIRMEEFARLAENVTEAMIEVYKLQEAYQIYEEDIEENYGE